MVADRIITPYLLLIYFNVQDENLAKAKKYLGENFESEYDSLPHVSLLISPVVMDNSEELITEIKNYFNKCKPFNVQVKDFHFESRNKFYQLRLKSPELIKIHHDLLIMVQKYRVNAFRQKDLDRISTGYFSDLELRMLEKWGYPRSDERLELHITVGNIIKAENFDEKEVTGILTLMLAQSTKIGLAIEQVGARILKEIPNQKDQEVVWEERFGLVQ